MRRSGLTESQILQLRRDLDKIYRLKNETLELCRQPGNVRVLKKIPEILRMLDSIASRARPANKKLDYFIREANLRFVGMDLEGSPWPVIEHEIQLFCEYLNSIAFSFTEEGVRILFSNSGSKSVFHKKKYQSSRSIY